MHVIRTLLYSSLDSLLQWRGWRVPRC